MEIISQKTYFIKFHFGYGNNTARANSELRYLFQENLHMHSLDIGEGDMRYFYCIDYYRLIQEIDNYLFDVKTASGRKRPKKVKLVVGLMFEMKWMGSILAIEEATQRLVDITEGARKRYNLEEATVFLGTEAYYYKDIKKPKEE
jgi:hypothetical protein